MVGGQINREVIRSSSSATSAVTKDIRYYYDASGRPIAIRAMNGNSSSDVVYYLQTNLQGDVVGIYNESGSKIYEYAYDAWGNIIKSSQVATGGNDAHAVNPFRYRGYYYDTETSLYYLQSRYYNPEWGRFLNADVYVNANGDLVGFNMFAYCSNNPVMYKDESGENASIAGWASTMWWLTLADGPIPVGDIVYVGGAALLGFIAMAQLDGGDKHHIIHGSDGGHEEGWKSFGVDPKKPDNDNWEILLPIINEVIKEGQVIQGKIVQDGNKVYYYAKDFVREGKTVIVKIWEEVQTGIQKLSDAWPLK